MRRTGSSSCLLKPKKSLSQHDLAVLHDKAPTATVLTVNRLPPYVTDRLYMLSELQVHAHSLQFLCDLKKNETKPSLPASIILYLRWKPDTYPTPISFADGPLSECVRQCLIANGDDAPFDELQFVRSKPREQPYSPRRQHYDELPAETVESLKKISIPLPLLGADGLLASKSTDTMETKHDEENENKQLTNIYVVVDRISPESNSDDLPDLPDLSCASYESIRRGEHSESSTQTTSQQQPQRQPQSEEQKELEQINQHDNEMKVVKSLARAIASSRFLRNRIDGVTIGLTSDARAAPGLEACMDTVARGAKERRRASTSKQVERVDGQGKRESALSRLREKSPERSPIAIVACEPDDLESDHEHSHHHHHHDADTHNKILQSRIITEWNGKGDCETFVDRAMSDWREAWSVSSAADKGLANNGVHQGKTRPKVPRISRNEDETEYEEECDIDEPVSTVMIIVLLGGILAYMWNLYGDDIHSLLTGDV
eukprot:scaffold4440_cov85-Skeletonema_marinoi.AAC.2